MQNQPTVTRNQQLLYSAARFHTKANKTLNIHNKNILHEKKMTEVL